MDGYVCERFYTDVFDGLRSVESGTPLRDFDFAFFSIQYEEDIFNAHEIIKRSDFSGLKVAGGPCIMENPLPYEKFFDVLFIGEIEGSYFIESLLTGSLSDDLSGVYIPSRESDARIIAGKRIKRVRSKLEEHLETQIIGNGAYGRSLLLEIGRGCCRNCRFCVVRQIYFPCRWRDKEIILNVAESLKGVTDRVAIISPSPSDHPQFKEIVFELTDMGYTISPSSLRADKINQELLDVLVASGLRSLTLAPEAGSEKLRETINKGISYDDIINAADIAKESGISKIKLYFMIGLPGEDENDLRSIVELSSEVKKKIKRVEISINPLVPKPHTPFQWLSFGGKVDEFDFVRDIKELKEKVKFLRRHLKGFDVKIDKTEDFAVQTVISRGGREVSKLIEGGKRRAFRNISELNLEKYLMPFEDDDLPWDFIDHGYKKERLRREFEKSVRS